MHPHVITYLRAGRQIRATGTIVDYGGGYTSSLTRVKPDHEGWGDILVTPEEIAAGSTKPPPVKRSKPATPSERKRRVTVPKPPSKPRWVELVELVRSYEADAYSLSNICPMPMHQVSELANLLADAQAKLSEFLPL